MVQGGERLRLALEADQTVGVARERLREDFERDLASELRVTRAIHLAHAAFAKLGEDLVGAEVRAWGEGHRTGIVCSDVYLFTWVGEGARDAGAARGSETAFFFNQWTLPPALGTAPYEGALRPPMSDYYVAFATNGDPTGRRELARGARDPGSTKG